MMQIARILCAAAAVLCAGSAGLCAVPAQNVEKAPLGFVVVTYFHGNFRCANCRNIEKYTKEAVEKYFSKELGSGKVVFRVINVETKGNEHFTDDYQLYTKSVIVSLMKGGKEAKFNNLTRIWEYLADMDAFQGYVKSEIERYLKEL